MDLGTLHIICIKSELQNTKWIYSKSYLFCPSKKKKPSNFCVTCQVPLPKTSEEKNVRKDWNWGKGQAERKRPKYSRRKWFPLLPSPLITLTLVTASSEEKDQGGSKGRQAFSAQSLNYPLVSQNWSEIVTIYNKLCNTISFFFWPRTN